MVFLFSSSLSIYFAPVMDYCIGFSLDISIFNDVLSFIRVIFSCMSFNCLNWLVISVFWFKDLSSCSFDICDVITFFSSSSRI